MPERVPVVVREPEAHEIEAVLACSEAAYSLRYPATTRERLIAQVEAGGFRCAFVGGELVGVLASYPIELTLPGPVLAGGVGVSEVAVHPAARRKGVLTALMDHALGEAGAAKRSLAALFASEGAIYGRFGFGPACYAARYELDRARAELAPGTSRPPGRVRLIDETEARSVLPAVFEDARRSRPGEVDRSPTWWDGVFDEHRQAMRPPGARFFACYVHRGRVDGYAVYDVATPARNEFSERILELVELVAIDEAAYVGLWAFLAGIDLVERIVTRDRPLDEPLRHLLADPRALETTRVVDHLWLRLVDVPAALSSRRYATAGELVLEVTGAGPEPGRFRLEVGPDGAAEAGPCSAPAELRLDLAALASCYLGATSPDSLARAGRVLELAPGAVSRARTLLSGPTPYSTADF